MNGVMGHRWPGTAILLAMASTRCILVAPASGASPDATATARPGRAAPGTGRELEGMIREAHRPRKHARFVPPNAPELDSFRTSFGRLLRASLEGVDRAGIAGGEPGESTREALGSLGFEVSIQPDGIDPLWVVREITGRSRGGGIFIIRVGPDAGEWRVEGTTSNVTPGAVARACIACPHPRTDKLTEILGSRLFERSRARVLAVATVSRDVLDPAGAKADPAHREDTFFQGACQAFDDVWSAGVHLQLHGFEAQKHEADGLDVDAILSDGLASGPHETTRQCAARLRREVPGLLLGLFGEEVSRLGGKTNSQGRMLRRSGRHRFLHLEMSRELRATLCGDLEGPAPADPQLLDALGRLLGGR